MFSGIVEEIGTVQAIESFTACQRYVIAATRILDDVTLGDSIAVNGVCLTVTAFDKTSFTVEAVPETLRLTNLGQLRRGSPVNLERAVQAKQRIGGHFVQGHIDTTTALLAIAHEGAAYRLTFAMPRDCLAYLVHKGFVTIDGVSLTLAAVMPEQFEVTIIPHTYSHTIFQQLKVGDRVNIEVDILGKYVEQLVNTRQVAAHTVLGKQTWIQ